MRSLHVRHILGTLMVNFQQLIVVFKATEEYSVLNQGQLDFSNLVYSYLGLFI